MYMQNILKKGDMWHMVVNKYFSQSRLFNSHVLLPISSSILIVLAAPPFDLWPFAFVSLVPLYITIRKSSLWEAVGKAWLAGFLMLLLGCHWWVQLLQEFVSLSIPQSIIVFSLICAYQALVFGLWAFCCNVLTNKFRLSWLVVGPLVFVLAEMAVPFIFKMYFAIAVWKVLPLIQIAEIGGPLAVSAVLVLINIVIAETSIAYFNHKKPGKDVKISALVIACCLVFGLNRIGQISMFRENAPMKQIGVVQPNFGILTKEKRQNEGLKYIRNLQNTSRPFTGKNIDLMVWPESAWPYPIDKQMEHDFPAGHPWKIQRNLKAPILMGTLSAGEGENNIYNSALLVDEKSDFAGWYDKNKLLPYAEYIPYKNTFPTAYNIIKKKLTNMPELVEGKTSSVLRAKDMNLGVLICSEEIDMWHSQKVLKNDPNLLVSLVNNAWFGASAAPLQHLALAVFRAVEARRDFIRCTNTGVSAFIDATGRVRSRGVLKETYENKVLKADTFIFEPRLLETFSLSRITLKAFPLVCFLVLLVLTGLAHFSKKKKMER